MLHLVQNAVNPSTDLRRSVQSWHEISCFLREAPRERALQAEELETLVDILS